MRGTLLRILDVTLDSPRRLRNSVRSARLKHLCSSHTSTTFTVEASVQNAVGDGAISVGEQCLVMGELLVIPPSGEIAIGDWCYVGPGAKIWSMSSIRIGDRVFISHGVQVFDNNSHSLSASERHARYRELRTVGRHLEQEQVGTSPVVIDDDAWLGFNVAVLKGVTIGRGAVVGACAVVVDDVPPYAVVVGNPARQVGDSRT